MIVRYLYLRVTNSEDLRYNLVSDCTHHFSLISKINSCDSQVVLLLLLLNVMGSAGDDRNLQISHAILCPGSYQAIDAGNVHIQCQ